MPPSDKRQLVFEAAMRVFSSYGFRRTRLADIAESAGISRPALYLLFENKEDLFRQLAIERQRLALEAAVETLSRPGGLKDRITQAILAYEQIYYEPVSSSPHGAEFLEVNQSVAFEDMLAGHQRLIDRLTSAIEAAIASGDATLPDTAATAVDFTSIMIASVTGQKRPSTSVEDFRRRVRGVTSVFLDALVSGG
ncbi:MAG: TetR/AcrR family transcriptional regulator [Pseudomonadota bacterium]